MCRSAGWMSPGTCPERNRWRTLSLKNASIQTGGGREERGRASVLFGSGRGAEQLSAEQLRKDEWETEGEVYWSHSRPVDLYSFDEDYLRRLGAHDPATEHHFVSYFS